MAFDDFRKFPRYSLNCTRWAQSGNGRWLELATDRRRAEEAQRRGRIRAFCRDHQCSEAEAERELYGEDDD